MRIARRFGMERTAWALRRLHCPVSPDELVLEVGSGGNPYPRADVLLDAYESTRERHWVPLKVDRPSVLAFVEELPFRDKAFDFVIASHVLEHSPNPDRFLAELQRVAKAGYIEVPDAFFERINPYRDHRLEITVRSGKLVIRKKCARVVDRQLLELYEDRAKAYMTRYLIARHPFAFHVRYYWEGTIDYEILNPETDACWEDVEGDRGEGPAPGIRARVHGWLLDASRSATRWSRNRREFDLLQLLRCPACHQEPLGRSDDGIWCNACGRVYPVRNGLPVLQHSAAIVARP